MKRRTSACTFATDAAARFRGPQWVDSGGCPNVPVMTGTGAFRRSGLVTRKSHAACNRRKKDFEVRLSDAGRCRFYSHHRLQSAVSPGNVRQRWWGQYLDCLGIPNRRARACRTARCRSLPGIALDFRTCVAKEPFAVPSRISRKRQLVQAPASQRTHNASAP